jgi:hypothetical protein
MEIMPADAGQLRMLLPSLRLHAEGTANRAACTATGKSSHGYTTLWQSWDRHAERRVDETCGHGNTISTRCQGLAKHGMALQQHMTCLDNTQFIHTKQNVFLYVSMFVACSGLPCYSNGHVNLAASVRGFRLSCKQAKHAGHSTGHAKHPLHNCLAAIMHRHSRQTEQQAMTSGTT